MPPEPGTIPSDLPLSELQRINEACNRFEAAWRAGQRPNLEEDLAEPPAALQQLILLDLDYRRQLGESPHADDYLARFPALDLDWLARAISEATGSLSPREFLARLARLRLLDESDLRPTGETTEALSRRLVAEGKLAEFAARALMGPIAVPLVLGPYVLDGWIAAGGMGQVFRATHSRMKRTVAVKVVHGKSATRPEMLRRFQHEVEVAGRLRHPNLVTAFDAGEQAVFR